MENRSLAVDEERSTYTEGESKSRRSSILKPPKARAPLQEVNLGGSTDDTEEFDTLRKRRVSFAGVNSVNSAAKSVQLVTFTNAVSSGEDHNFADDPMDLTDSIIDNNHAPNSSAPRPVVRVTPIFTASGAPLSEFAMNMNSDLASCCSRKSGTSSNAQNSVVDRNMSCSNMSLSSIVGVPGNKASKNPDPAVAPSSPWSCSMEITEPVHILQNKMSSVNVPSNHEQMRFPPFRNSCRPPECSDSGMEFTEGIPMKIRPFSINQADDNLGDTSMEMTEMIKKSDIKSFCSRMSFTNKSASMDCTEVAQIQRKSAHFQNVQSRSIENSTGNSGMEFTEPIKRNVLLSEPNERAPFAQHRISAPKSSVAPQVHHSTPFPHVDNLRYDAVSEKSMLETSVNHSLSDMEITGVLSLSRYGKLAADDDNVEDMDFTQLISVNAPKKARVSNEPEEEPFKITSPLSTKATNVQQESHENMASRQSFPASLAENKLVNQTELSDALALNFKNINRGQSPIELSFHNELRDSSTTDKPAGKANFGHNLTMNQSVSPQDHEHLLLYSPPKDSKPPASGNELKIVADSGRKSTTVASSNQKSEPDSHQPIPTYRLSTVDKCSNNSFEAHVVNELWNAESENISDPLRNARSSRSLLGDVSHPGKMRTSFKNFEIKPDSIAASESLSTFGLNDSDILKAGLDDMTCPERVPSVCISMTSNLASPCSKSRLSLADRNTFGNSVTQKVDKRGVQETNRSNSFLPEFGLNVNDEALGNHHINRLEPCDEQNISVSVPFVFKPLPNRKSEAPKFDQSIPILEFKETSHRQGLQPVEATGVCSPSQNSPVEITSFPLGKKSVGSNNLISDKEADDQDTSMSMPFVFKAVAGKITSDVHKVRQSFPVIEFGEAQSSTQMELTEVTPPCNIEARKSMARVSFAPEGTSIHPSYSSGQMELTSAAAVGRKSLCPSNHTTAQSSRDSFGIEMDETLMTMKSPEKDVSDLCSDTMGNTEGPAIENCDMEDTNVKPKDVEKHRRSFFPQDQSPMSLTSEETLIRPSTSDVGCVVEQSRKSCVSIDNEDTLSKSTPMNYDVPPRENVSTSAADVMDMEETALSPQIRRSLAHDIRELLDPQVSPKISTVDEVQNPPKPHDPSDLHCPKRTILDDYLCMNGTVGIDQFLNVGMDNPEELKPTHGNRRSDFFPVVDEPHDLLPPARLSSRKSGFGLANEGPSELECELEDNENKPPLDTSIEISGNAFSDIDTVDKKSESIEVLSIPPVQEVSHSESCHEQNDGDVIEVGMQLSKKSVHLFNAPEKENSAEPCGGIILSPERESEVDVEQAGNRVSELMSTSGCCEVQLINNLSESAENVCPLPRRSARKSTIGCRPPSPSSEGVSIESLKSNPEDVSGEVEFSVRRNKRKSTIGTRPSENDADIDLQKPEDCHKLGVIALDVQQYVPEMSPRPECMFGETDPQGVEKDVDLSQDMMNISLNDGELSEPEIEKLHTTSTPLKLRLSCAGSEDSKWDRKRNHSGAAKTPSFSSELTHDLSQDMMNISIHSDTRSPLPKKLSIHPTRTSTASSTSSYVHLNDKCSSSAPQPPSGQLPLYESGCHPSFGSLKSDVVGYIPETLKTLEQDLPYNTRVQNRDFMRSHGFYLLGSQTNWESLLFDKVLGIKVVLPLCKFSEHTKIESIQYTFYSWRIGRTLFLDRETVEFIRTRIHRNMPEQWLREECNKIGDLDRFVSSLKSVVEKLKPLIDQLDYVKRRHPCSISNDSFSFRIVNPGIRINCEVTLDLKNSHEMSDCYITVKNCTGKLDLDTVRLVFRALPSSDVDVLYRFVRCLESDTSNFLVRE